MGPPPRSSLSETLMHVSRRTFLAATAAAAAAGCSTGNTRAGSLSRQLPAGRFDPWIEVDPDALSYNLGQVRRLSSRPVLAVVKNYAYGLGLELTARLLEPMPGIDGFAVVRTQEAIALRDAGITKPILLMARAADSDIPELARRNIEFAIFADDEVRRLASSAAGVASVPVHFYIDSGMGRMGLPYHRALPLMREATSSNRIAVKGTFTEFAEDAEFDREQLRRFRELVARAVGERLDPGRLHAASSNGVFHLPEAHLDLVRPGIALYGAYPSRPDEERARAELRPAFRLRARVVRVEQLRPGDSVSYGRHYIADRPVYVATLPVGHSDGYPREAVNGGRVLIGGRLYPVIGAVSASHCIVEIGDDASVRIGDVVTFIGPDDPAIHPNTLAGTLGVSVYDLLMHLSPTLPRYVT
jgi:alanine racemase